MEGESLTKQELEKVKQEAAGYKRAKEEAEFAAEEAREAQEEATRAAKEMREELKEREKEAEEAIKKLEQVHNENLAKLVRIKTNFSYKIFRKEKKKPEAIRKSDRNVKKPAKYSK